MYWLLLTALLVESLQDPDEAQIREVVEAGFRRYSQEDRDAALGRLLLAYKGLDPKYRKAGMSVIVAEIQFASRMFPRNEAYDRIRQAHPGLEKVEIPLEFYLREYSIAIGRINQQFEDSKRGAARNPAAIVTLTSQIDALTMEARNLLNSKYPSGGMSTLIEERVAKARKALQELSDSEFIGYDRALSESEVASVRHDLSSRLNNLPAFELDEYLGEVRGMRAQGAADDAARKAVSVIDAMLNSSFGLIDRLERPETMKLLDHRRQLLQEVISWWLEETARVRPQYAQYLTTNVEASGPDRYQGQKLSDPGRQRKADHLDTTRHDHSREGHTEDRLSPTSGEGKSQLWRIAVGGSLLLLVAAIAAIRAFRR